MEEAEIKIPPNSLKELVVRDNTFRSAYDFCLSEADHEKSCRELNETEEVRNVSLQKLKEMFSKDKDIRYRTDDDYLIRYLRYRKFNFKEAYKIIRHFYVLRMECPDLFDVAPNLESLLNSKIENLMPYTDEEGSLIFIAKYGNWKTDEMTIHDLIHMFNILSNIITMNPHVQINGIIAIWDFKNTRVNHIAQAFHPSAVRLWTKMLQELYPWRIKRIILINCNAVLYTCFLGIRYLLKKKIADRVTPLRSDLSQLHEYVNPALLPKEYGGSLEDSECYSYMIQPILDNVEYLKYEQSFIDTQKS